MSEVQNQITIDQIADAYATGLLNAGAIPNQLILNYKDYEALYNTSIGSLTNVEVDPLDPIVANITYTLLPDEPISYLSIDVFITGEEPLREEYKPNSLEPREW
jgi:hypothetical protein